MGFYGSSVTMKKIDPLAAEQLVVDQMDHDITKRSGVRTVQAKIAFERGIHLSRYIFKSDISIYILLNHNLQSICFDYNAHP